MIRAPEWRREAAQALPAPRAGRWQGQPEGACLGAKYICKLCQGDDSTQNFIYSSPCCFSLHKQHPSSKISRKGCLPRAKFNSALITSSKDCLPNSYPTVYPQNQCSCGFSTGNHNPTLYSSILCFLLLLY